MYELPEDNFPPGMNPNSGLGPSLTRPLSDRERFIAADALEQMHHAWQQRQPVPGWQGDGQSWNGHDAGGLDDSRDDGFGFSADDTGAAGLGSQAASQPPDSAALSEDNSIGAVLRREFARREATGELWAARRRALCGPWRRQMPQRHRVRPVRRRTCPFAGCSNADFRRWAARPSGRPAFLRGQCRQSRPSPSRTCCRKGRSSSLARSLR